MAAETATPEQTLRELMSSMQAAPAAPTQPSDEIEAALAECRRLYAGSRSHDALPIARAALALASDTGDRILIRRASTAAGLLCGDTGDIVGAIEFHLRSLRLASEDEDRQEM